MVYLPDDRIAFVGDLLVNSARPVQPRLGDGDPRDWLRALDELEARGVTAVVGGHGPVGTAADFALVRDYLAAVESVAAVARVQGVTADEAAVLTAPPPFDAWGGAEAFGQNVDFYIRLAMSAVRT